MNYIYFYIRSTPFVVYFFLFLFPSTPIFSQKIQWQQSIGGKQGDYLFDIISTPDHGFLLAGSSLSKSSDLTDSHFENKNSSLDYFLWKMNRSGILEWQKKLGGDRSDYLYSVNLTRDGGYILGGSSYSSFFRDKKDSCRGEDDYWIIKLNAYGNEEWQKTLGGTGSDKLLSIEQTWDGGYIVGGSSDSPPSYEKLEDSRGAMDFWICKLDSKGQIEWQKTLGGSGYDLLRRIKATSDGYILAGYSNSPKSGEKSENTMGQGDFWLVKLDHNGYKLWDKTIGGHLDDELMDLIITSDGNYLLAGSSNSPQEGNKTALQGNGSDIWLVKTNRQGEILWQKSFDIGRIDTPNKIKETKKGNILISGNTIQSNTNGEIQSDYLVIKISESGDEIWRKQLGGPKRDWLQNTVETTDGYLLLAGTSDSPKGNDKTVETNGQTDFWIVKLQNEDDHFKTFEIKEMDAYPNPTERFVNVIIYKELSGTETIYVHDITGKLLQQNKIKSGTTPIDLGEYTPGVYILSITLSNERTHTLKILKI
uniref:T9SS type A sorting domain-containing protein n=2 Tax=Apibacter TaxID=1778601 RepID=UPI0026ECF18E